jgi:hypothetical protein
MRFLAGDSWESHEKKRRMDNKIPMPHFDELTQYVNQLVNDVRQNKRAVKVLPKGSVASDKSAGLREDWIRGIEYSSSAQTAYITAFDSMASRSFGFWKLITEYESDDSFNLTARIKRIANPKTILFDPDCKEYDCSDAEDCFEIDFMSQASFKRQYKDAEIVEFTDEIREVAPEWISNNRVQVASWWRVKYTPVKLCLVRSKQGQLHAIKEEHLPEDLKGAEVIRTREVQERRVVQYLLNGVEVLETNDPEDGKGWPGRWIPIIPVWGKELYLPDTNGTKRCLHSHIRLARDPQRGLNYHVAQEFMEAKMSPRAPFIGAKGQFDTNTPWDTVNETPVAFLEYDPRPEGANETLPPPARPAFAPNFQQYELVKESAKRSIQSAMGITPLPTQAQRANEKSGVALERIQGSEQLGSFHFIDNFERSLEYSGRQLDDLYDKIVDTPRKIATRSAQDRHRVIDVTPDMGKGEHDVTITTGPSYQSQREEAAAFADTISQVDGVFPLIGDLIVRMRDLGPIGDEIADRLLPPQFAQKDDQGEPVPPKYASQIAGLQRQLQGAQAALQQYAMEKAAKTVDGQVKLKIAALQEQTKLVIAQATLQANQAEVILQNEYARIQTILQTIGDITQAGQQADLEQQSAQQQAQLDQQGAAHQAGLDQQSAAHQAGLDTQAATNQAALERLNAAHSASLPQPTPAAGKGGKKQ